MSLEEILQKVDVLIKTKKFTDAKTIINKLIEKNPKEAILYYKLAVIKGNGKIAMPENLKDNVNLYKAVQLFDINKSTDAEISAYLEDKRNKQNKLIEKKYQPIMNTHKEISENLIAVNAEIKDVITNSDNKLGDGTKVRNIFKIATISMIVLAVISFIVAGFMGSFIFAILPIVSFGLSILFLKLNIDWHEKGQGSQIFAWIPFVIGFVLFMVSIFGYYAYPFEDSTKATVGSLFYFIYSLCLVLVFVFAYKFYNYTNGKHKAKNVSKLIDKSKIINDKFDEVDKLCENIGVNIEYSLDNYDSIGKLLTALQENYEGVSAEIEDKVDTLKRYNNMCLNDEDIKVYTKKIKDYNHLDADIKNNYSDIIAEYNYNQGLLTNADLKSPEEEEIENEDDEKEDLLAKYNKDVEEESDVDVDDILKNI